MTEKTDRRRDDVGFALMGADIKQLVKDTDEIKSTMKQMQDDAKNSYVTKDELQALRERVDLLQKIIFGVIATVGLGVVGALLRLVVRGA